VTIRPVTSFLASTLSSPIRPAATGKGGVTGSSAASTGTANEATLFQSALARASSQNESAYDFTHMTPGRMQTVAQELHKAGKIDPVQLFELQTAGMPLGKVGPNGQFIPLSAGEKAQYTNRPVDYTRVAQDAIAFLEQSGRAASPTSTIDEWKGILKTLQDMQGQVAQA
jgi:hypothetical protein